MCANEGIMRKVFTKNRIIGGLLTLLWLPFVSMQSWYPLYHFGMFANPQGVALAPAESFEIVCQYGQQTFVCSAAQIGLNPDNFRYLKRNYYYRQQAADLLRIVAGRFEHGGTCTWTFYRIVETPTQPDTIPVAYLPASVTTSL